MKIIKPTLSDVKQIKNLMDIFVKRKDILPRSSEDIAERIREFVVIKDRDNIVALSGLKLYYPDLAEIRTVVVHDVYQGLGFGRKLIEFEVNEAKLLNVKMLFALTFKAHFFTKLGFNIIDKKTLPSVKIWEDCLKCPFFPDCEEEGVIKQL